MIKLIASDVDGTLVEDGTTAINPEIFEIITKLHSKGIHFAIASGRQWCSIENLFKPVREKIFYISDNGAYIGMHGRRLMIHNIERSVFDELVRSAREAGDFTLVAAGENSYYAERAGDSLISWVREGYKGRIENVDDITAANLEFTKLSIYCPDNIYEKTEALYEKYRDKLQVNYAGTMWLDFTANNVSKGSAIRELQEALGVSPCETMVFGDQDNDVEMLKSAYYSFAVSNAVETAKRAARFEADSNANDGVLKILKALL